MIGISRMTLLNTIYQLIYTVLHSTFIDLHLGKHYLNNHYSQFQTVMTICVICLGQCDKEDKAKCRVIKKKGQRTLRKFLVENGKKKIYERIDSIEESEDVIVHHDCYRNETRATNKRDASEVPEGPRTSKRKKQFDFVTHCLVYQMRMMQRDTLIGKQKSVSYSIWMINSASSKSRKVY